VLCVVAALSTAAGLSACSSNKSSSSGTSTPTTASPASSSTAAPATTTTGAAGAAACAAGALAITEAGSQGAAGTLEVTFALRNTSTTSCPMNGFPGAQMLGSSGTQIPTHVVRAGNYPFTDFPPSPVVLTAGSTAYFNLGYSDVPTGGETTCPTAAQLEVTPPNAVDHDVVPVQFVVCNAGTLTVSPVFGAGSSVAHTTAPPQP
jgi:hypothetical protein